jgi:2-hydroxymuconate-semialdehyde hydrolase
MSAIHSKYVLADGTLTHYLEAGSGPPLILLHSGEFGGCAELSWEHNIEALASHFHVYAPDWLGYGKSEKLFDFKDMWGRRIRHIADFLRTLCIDRAHFVGNSMGGTILFMVAAMDRPAWPLNRIVIVSGGGTIPENAARDILNTYDCSLDHMRRLIGAMFADPAICNDAAYIRRRHEISLEPGAWECTAAMRFRPPSRPPSGLTRPTDYPNVKAPTLIIAGSKDQLRDPGYAAALQRQVPGSQLVLFENAGHCPQIEDPKRFNQVALHFLLQTGSGTSGCAYP